jgi:hypothetical protein
MSKTRIAAAAALAAALSAGVASSASAHNSTPGKSENRTQVFRAELTELNDSGATGKAHLRLKGNELTIRIRARGLAPNLVHAQHIHGVGNSECPPPAAAGPDGVLSTADGLPFYGPIVSSLTTRGDTSPAAGLDIEVMPVADGNGRVDYRRTITLPNEVASNLSAFQIVQHGVDLNHNAQYDFGAGASELNAAFPQEATAPANCGTIDSRHHRR